MSFKIRCKRFGKNNAHCKKVAVIQGGELDKKCLYLCDDDSGLFTFSVQSMKILY